MPSIVVTARCPIVSTGKTQDRTGAPSRCTVHAPHRAIPQPNLVPVKPSTSRNTHSSGVSPSTSTEWIAPFTLSCSDMGTPLASGWFPAAVFWAVLLAAVSSEAPESPTARSKQGCLQLGIQFQPDLRDPLI